jgi:hypothetical protein
MFCEADIPAAQPARSRSRMIGLALIRAAETRRACALRVSLQRIVETRCAVWQPATGPILVHTCGRGRGLLGEGVGGCLRGGRGGGRLDTDPRERDGLGPRVVRVVLVVRVVRVRGRVAC